MKDGHKLRPERFKKNPYYLTGCYTCSLHIKKGKVSMAYPASIIPKKIMPVIEIEIPMGKTPGVSMDFHPNPSSK
jgi:hypothetical protein